MISKTEVLVLGAGVSGLSCAIALADAGYDVTIWTKDLTANTTSAKAGAFWEPYECQPQDRALVWARQTFQYFKTNVLPDQTSGVAYRWSEIYNHEQQPEPWWRPAVDNFEQLSNDQIPLEYSAGFRYQTLLIDTSRYLPWLLEQVTSRHISIQQKEIADFAQTLGQHPIVINCTGLGSRELCGDDRLFPVRGQVVRVSAVDLDKIIQDESDTNPVYVVPRTNDVIVGGTAQANDWNADIDPADSESIMKRAVALVPELKDAAVLESKVGLRPARDEVRLEIENFDTGSVIHNYGHGGVGYSISWGCAQEVVELVKSQDQ